MATDDSHSVETRIGQAPVFSVEMGAPDGSKPEVRQQVAEGSTAEFDDDGQVNVHDSDKAGAAQKDQGAEGGQEGDSEAGETVHDLPAFDANNQEVVEQYATAYITDSGEPNLDALSAAWFKNAKKDASGNWSGELPADVYAYLDTQGYPKDLVKSVEAGQVALLQQQEHSVYARAGGAENLQKALEWARNGGYNAAQRGRYNDVVVKGRDRDAAGDQIDLLMQRFQAATGNGRRAASRVNPRRSVSANAGASGTSAGSGTKGYATRDEYMADLKKAQKENDKALLAETRKRLAVSTWVKSQ